MPTLGNIVIYADDPPRLAAFWSDVFGYPHAEFEGELRDTLLANGLTEEDLSHRGLAEDPTGKGPRLFFHHADGPKTQRNRVHIDVTADRPEGQRHIDAETLDAEKDRLVALGAMVVRLVEQNWGPWPERYWQMRDPEGNEFCLQ